MIVINIKYDIRYILTWRIFFNFFFSLVSNVLLYFIKPSDRDLMYMSVYFYFVYVLLRDLKQSWCKRSVKSYDIFFYSIHTALNLYYYCILLSHSFVIFSNHRYIITQIHTNTNNTNQK